MAEQLPRLRLSLDFMPSPVPERPGLFIRDPYRYSDAMLVIPPALVPCLQYFDGSQTGLDLRAELVRITGELDVSTLQQHLTETLSTAGFLEDAVFAGMRDSRHREFAAAPVREPAHAGGAYPADPAALLETLDRYLDGAAAGAGADLLGIAAPHVSPEGGWASYRAAYGALRPELKDRTFVILATSHYGEPEHFGLTRKPFRTPLGEAVTDTRLVDRLQQAGGPAVQMEDYCHSFEHTVELQVIFLQRFYGPGVRILPILCGQFAKSVYVGGKPESDEGVRRFFDALGEMASVEARHLFWVLGIDMAHMGARYRDTFHATANAGIMSEVAERDHRRIDHVNAGDADAYWDLVQEKHDDLKWCGSAPLYTFMRALPEARGRLLRYEQWNIDPQSVVSFAGMAFGK